MGVTFGGRNAVDPVALWEDARVIQPPLPTWNWWGKVNSFRCSAGAEPGRGWLLLHRHDLDELNLNTTHDLVLQYGRTVTVKSLLVVHAECVTPRERAGKQPAYVVEVADQRHLLKSFSPLVDRAYNVRSGPAATTFLSATLNTGSEWTWTAMVSDLWTAVGTSRLGSYPGLPFSPHGNPEAFEFFQTSAYDALNQVLDRLACVLTLNPFTGAFGIARVGSTDAALTAALLRWDAERIWDDDALEPNQARLPQYVRVLFRRQPEANDGNSPWYAVDVADTSPATGFYSGGYVTVHDDLAALGATGTPSNSATLATRAAERAADWFRAVRQGWAALRRVYRDALPEAGFAPGSQLSGVAWEDRGLGYKTEVGRSGKFRDLLRDYLPLSAATGAGSERIWARVTDANNFAYSWVEAEPITPTAGAFATSTGTSFQDKSGGRSGTLNLYDRFRTANIPAGAHVQIYPGVTGDYWICEFEQDHFTGTIRGGTGPSYTVEENNAGDNARTVTAAEFNGAEDIPLGTVVQVWVYTASDGSLTYQFAYELAGCAACVTITTVNVTNIYNYTADPGTLYFNQYNSLLYLYIAGYGWYPVCCPTGTGSGSGSSGSGGTALNACCPGGIPNTLYAHPTHTAGTCNFPFPSSTPLYFVGASAVSVDWQSDCYYDSGNNCYARLAMACYSAGPFAGQVAMGGVFKAPDSCSPFSAAFTGVQVLGEATYCGSGTPCCDTGTLVTYDVTVNTTP